MQNHMGQKFVFLMYSIAKRTSEISITNARIFIFSFNLSSNSGSHLKVIVRIPGELFQSISVQVML